MIHLLRPRSSSGAHSVFPAYSNEDAIFSKLVFASYAAAIAVAYECKDIPTIKRLYGSSQQFLLSAHSSIFDKISGLQATYGGQNTSSMRFVTYATNVTEGLKALLKTAAIAGVSVKVCTCIHLYSWLNAVLFFINVFAL
ncbi:hypothetical protein EON65_04160 [archaeon]|nr:MAG: hypothetical protein EON65_04160 [archaeon]